jgi:hypothetical protein
MPNPIETRSSNAPFHLATLGIIIGVVLTGVSWFKLCSQSCNNAHNYRLFGLPFEWTGLVFFASFAFFHFKGRTSPFYRTLAGLSIAGALGAETFFIFLQKYTIGSWCPVCLSIAGTIALIGICYIFLNQRKPNEGLMNTLLNVGLLTAVFTMGFTTSFLGISKIDQLQAVEDVIKEKIKFGNTSSPVQVYIFTDWACPACRMVEPAIEAMAPQLMKVAQITFVDTVVHPETLNYAPYNISFMANSKPKYFQIRDALGKLSVKTKKPTEDQVRKTVSPLGVHYDELPFEDITVAMRYFEELTDKFKVTGTPTIAIVNTSAKKGKKLAGVEEITEANVLKAIQALK